MALFATVSLILSCQAEDSGDVDRQYCKCLEITEDVRAKSATLMEGDISDEEWVKITDLIETMKTTCKDYEKISVEEELRLKEQCENR